MMTTMSSFDSIVARAQRAVGALGSAGRTRACAYERHECLRCVTRPDPPCLVPGSTRPDPTRLHATAGRPGLRPEAAGPKAGALVGPKLYFRKATDAYALSNT